MTVLRTVSDKERDQTLLGEMAGGRSSRTGNGSRVNQVVYDSTPLY